ncbi:hypothetical protein BLA24_09255 [Streptomyces cinnamoneus]|uniref:PLL-like beta propeller domain-containing protein n=1 Tax=Streptomyces cinnamoneus TaxID=53446 RepID=A0A2G1XLP2_STRCJ|nr:hypothetical protein [Streptomyces cinnamoneus]PHQ52101.1 hypothetical protein BLA24_09255 [Streptomyces cinnamoneus]PPT16181.1 hypothetical protein CYQ11_27865 [Streptomyces cinnamoneus]
MPVSTAPGTKWGNWTELEGTVHAEPSAALNSDNRVQAFVRGEDGSLWTIWETRARGWSAWLRHEGARIAGAPSAIRGRDGRIRVFYRTPDHHLEVVAQTAVNTVFGPPQRIVTNVGGDPAATLDADGRIHVFFRGTDGALWYTRNQNLAYATYSGPASLGGALTETPSPALDGSGRIVVAVRGEGDTLHAVQQKAADSADAWDAFQRRAEGVTSRPSAIVDAASRVQIFYRGADGAAWRAGQGDDYEGWGSPASLGGAIADRPTACLGQDGRVNVLAKGTDGKLWVTVQSAGNGAAYDEFQSLGGEIGEVGANPVIMNRVGLLYVFTQGSGEGRGLWLQRQNWA